MSMGRWFGQPEAVLLVPRLRPQETDACEGGALGRCYREDTASPEHPPVGRRALAPRFRPRICPPLRPSAVSRCMRTPRSFLEARLQPSTTTAPLFPPAPRQGNMSRGNQRDTDRARAAKRAAAAGKVTAKDKDGL